MGNLEQALQYVREHKTWTEEQETRALLEIDHSRCPLRMTHDGREIEEGIHDLMEEYSDENYLPEEWWYEEGDAEDIFWLL